MDSMLLHHFHAHSTLKDSGYGVGSFRWLFSDKNNLLSLYNAIAGAHYQDPETLNIVTLESAIYMGMKNDLAFVLETGLYLYEHQSTLTTPIFPCVICFILQVNISLL